MALERALRRLVHKEVRRGLGNLGRLLAERVKKLKPSLFTVGGCGNLGYISASRRSPTFIQELLDATQPAQSSLFIPTSSRHGP
jgi:hypothetical protein